MDISTRLHSFAKPWLLIASLFMPNVWANHLPDQLVLGVHPYLPPNELLNHFSPLLGYLSEALDTRVRLHISGDYRMHLEETAQGTFDIAYMGPASYVQWDATQDHPTLLAKLSYSGKSSFQGIIAALGSSSIHQLSELKGRRMAFGDPQSTMSSIVPKQMLEQAGIPLESLSRYRHLSNHHNVVLSLLLGQYDAGAIKEDIFLEYQDRGLKIIARSPEIPSHLFVATRNLDPAQAERVRALLLNLHRQPRGGAILQALEKGVTALVPVNDADYDSLRALMAYPSRNQEH